MGQAIRERRGVQTCDFCFDNLMIGGTTLCNQILRGSRTRPLGVELIHDAIQHVPSMWLTLVEARPGFKDLPLELNWVVKKRPQH
jgi:hypothetical protein